MNRKVRYFCRWTMVVCLIALMSASPASAGWLLNKIRCKRKSRCKPVCVVPARQCPPVVNSCQPAAQPALSYCASPAPMVTAHVETAYFPPVETAYAAVASACCCCNDSIGNVISPGVVTSQPMVIDSAPMIDSVDYGTPLDAGQILGEAPVVDTLNVDDSTMSLSDEIVVVGDEADSTGTAATEAIDTSTNDAAEINMPAETPAVDSEATPDSKTEAPPAPVIDPEPPEPTPAVDPEPAPPVDPAPPKPTPAEDKKPAANSDPFGGAAPADTAPAADDPFGAPASTTPDPTPADNPAPADDPFGAPATTPAEPAPADNPVGSADAAMDDLFGGSDDPATDPAPAVDPAPAADDPFGAPASTTPDPAPADNPTRSAAAAMDDLFGSSDAPAATDPAPAVDPAPAADDPFGAPATPPAGDAAPAVGDAGLDDLFGGSDAAAPADTAPADKPPADATPAAGDDPFGAPPAGEPEVPAGDGGLDDLFGTPPADDAPAGDAPKEGSLDDLFGAVENAESTIENLPAPKSEIQHKNSNVLAVTKIISQAVSNFVDAKRSKETVASKAPTIEPRLQVVSVPRMVSIDPLSQTRVRTWIDNTGQFRTTGRLIEINATHVRLVKSNGRTCTVPLSRMCGADAAYVTSLRGKVNDARLAMLTSM